MSRPEYVASAAKLIEELTNEYGPMFEPGLTDQADILRSFLDFLWPLATDPKKARYIDRISQALLELKIN